ncbi:hypothetical protein H0H92_002259 [Tricholoma furcatifolium]|nr:hypothetical protein H0H92_002259 [Tricholoma furcatifolium]
MPRPSFILLLLALVSLVAAHGNGHGHKHGTDDGHLSELPECSQICAHSAAIGAECYSSDTPCLCTSVEFVTETLKCASKVCAAEELKKSVGVLKEMCQTVKKAVESGSIATRKESSTSSESVVKPTSAAATGSETTSETATVVEGEGESEAKGQDEDHVHEEL